MCGEKRTFGPTPEPSYASPPEASGPGQGVSETDPKSQLKTRRLQRSDVVARLTG